MSDSSRILVTLRASSVPRPPFDASLTSSDGSGDSLENAGGGGRALGFEEGPLKNGFGFGRG